MLYRPTFEILKSWGVNQIGMPMSATPEALQKGLVQGVWKKIDEKFNSKTWPPAV